MLTLTLTLACIALAIAALPIAATCALVYGLMSASAALLGSR